MWDVDANDGDTAVKAFEEVARWYRDGGLKTLVVHECEMDYDIGYRNDLRESFVWDYMDISRAIGGVGGCLEKFPQEADS